MLAAQASPPAPDFESALPVHRPGAEERPPAAARNPEKLKKDNAQERRCANANERQRAKEQNLK